MIIPKDEAVRDSIRKDLDTSLVIEAGAGTGKTTLLIDRLMALLHRFDITEIAAITFTEKAAAELSERLRTELEKSASGAEESQPHLRALNRFDQGHLTTIHSFAASIVRERPIEAGIDPEFVIIEPDAETELLQSVLTNDLSRFDEMRDSAIVMFLRLGGTFDNIQELLGRLHDHRDLIERIPTDSRLIDVSGVMDHFAQQIKYLEELVEHHCRNTGDRLQLKLNEISSDFPVGESSFWNWLGKWKPFKTTRLGAKKNWDSAEALDSCRTELQQFSDDVSELVYSVRSYSIEKIIVWLRKIINRVEKIKSERGQYGYQDLLLLARKLLDKSDIVQHFQDKYKRILIDEFQDTDPLQVEIAMILAQKSPDNTVAEPGKLSVVGDPKQSIYRFRRADPRVYQSATDDILKKGSKLFITQNFRSAAGVVNFVNRFFQSVWDDLSGDDSAYIPIDRLEGRIELFPVPSVSILTPQSQQYNDNANADAVRLAEARAIAGKISTAFERWMVAVKQADNTFISRVAGYGDIAILFPSTTDLEVYSDTLAEAGIPFQVEGGKKFYKTQIVIDLFNCIAAIDNPGDRLAVVGALRSPFFGVSDDDLVKWMWQSGSSLDYRQAASDGSVPLAEAFTILSELHDLRKSLAPDLLIQKLLDSVDALPAIGSQPHSESDITGLQKIIDLSKMYAESGDGSLRGFRRWLSNRMSFDDEKQSGSPDSRDRVKLMTVHAAKGLEFPIVFMANMNSDFKNYPNVIPDRLHRLFEIGIGSRSKGIRFETSGFNDLLPEEKRIQAAESLRLLYVAMTRARDHLVLPLYYGKRLTGYAKWLDKFLKEEAVTETTDLFRTIEAEPYAVPAETDTDVHDLTIDSDRIWNDKEQWKRARSERLAGIKDRLPKVIHPSGHVLQVAPERPSNSGEGVTIAGAIGRAVHSYMSLCRVEQVIDQQLMEHFAKEEGLDANDVSALILNCLQSGVWSNGVKAKRLWREVPISVKTADGLVRGSVDIMWEDEAGLLHIADWKTGSYDPLKHQAQIKQYVSAIELSTGCRIASSYLYFAKDNQSVEVSLE